MNLNAYDNVDESIINKTWINPRYRKLYSREIEYYPMYCLLKRYNDTNKRDEYYLCLANTTDKNHDWHTTPKYNNSVKISLSEIWNKSSCRTYVTITYIAIALVDSQPDGKVYRLGI
jgi:hypothetical protein